jgi:hypothetical protein
MPKDWKENNQKSKKRKVAEDGKDFDDFLY